MQLKFCCDKFRFFYTGEKNVGLNVRIVKASEKFMEGNKELSDNTFMITEGYLGKIEDCKKKMVISYCPFCGIKLSKKYSKDEYVQEIVDI